jgi:hypothetical protein
MTTNVLEDEANLAFLALLSADEAEEHGVVAVDSGHIELGDCGNVQVTVQTNFGDGFYSVWRGKKYLVIEMDMFNSLALEKAVDEELEESA